MKKSYDISKNSDMRRFMKDLESSVMSEAKKAANSMNHDYTCPTCNHDITVRVGFNSCPYCGQEIEVNPMR